MPRSAGEHVQHQNRDREQVSRPNLQRRSRNGDRDSPHCSWFLEHEGLRGRRKAARRRGRLSHKWQRWWLWVGSPHVLSSMVAGPGSDPNARESLAQRPPRAAPLLSGGSNSLTIIRVTGNASGLAVLSTPAPISVPAFGNAPSAPQLGASPLIVVGDARLEEVVHSTRRPRAPTSRSGS